MKIPSIYSNKKNTEQYVNAFKKVPFDKLPFVLHSLSSYPPPVLNQLTPLISARLYPVRHDPRFSKYTATFAPYLFKEDINPSWERWFNGLAGNMQEESCILRLISSGLLQEQIHNFPALKGILKNFINCINGSSIERISKALCQIGNEKVLQYAMEVAPSEVNTTIMRELSQRPAQLPSSFVKNFPVSSVDFKDVLNRYGLIKSLWNFPEVFSQSFTSQYIRKNIHSLGGPKIYQGNYNRKDLTEKDQQMLTDFYRHLFQTDVKAKDFLWYNLCNKSFSEFFNFSLIEASSEEDLESLIPHWEKSEDKACLKYLEHPKVIRYIIKKEVSSKSTPTKSRKM